MQRIGTRTIAGVAVAAATTFAAWSFAQAPQPSRPAAEPGGRVALCDLGHVIKQYRKFETLQADLKTEVADRERRAAQMAVVVKQLQAELEKGTKGTADYESKERDVDKLTREFEDFRKDAQRGLIKKEADNYRTIYLEVRDVVERFAQEQGIAVVIRFRRSEADDASDPQKIMQSLNDTVLYHRPQDDLTDAVLKRLNDAYGKK